MTCQYGCSDSFRSVQRIAIFSDFPREFDVPGAGIVPARPRREALKAARLNRARGAKRSASDVSAGGGDRAR